MKERKKKIARMLKKGLVCSMVGVMMLSMAACGSTGKKTETKKQKSEVSQSVEGDKILKDKKTQKAKEAAKKAEEEKKAKEAEEAAKKAEEEKKAKEAAEAAKQQAGTNASQNQGKVEGTDKKEEVKKEEKAGTEKKDEKKDTKKDDKAGNEKKGEDKNVKPKK